MSSGKATDKDKWDILRIGAEIAIPIVGLVFTYFYQGRQQRTADAQFALAGANQEVAKAQVESSLLPFLSNQDPKQREMALRLAQALDEKLAADLAMIWALHDPSLEVRVSAGSALRSLSQSGRNDVKQVAQEGLKRYEIVNELRNKGILKKLNEAEGYVVGGGSSGRQKALELYREVVNQASPEARKSLDQKVLSDAEQSYKAEHWDDSIQDYRALFADYRQAASQE